MSTISPRYRTWWALAAGAALASACGGAAATSTDSAPSAASGHAGTAGDGTATATAAGATPPVFRLPRTVLPTRYRARLRLDPAQPTFTGHVDIEANVAEATEVFWLNAEGISIDRATVNQGGGEALSLVPIPVDHDFVGFRAPAPLQPGPAIISIDYAGKIDDSDTLGIFRQQEGKDWYVFTQFESLGARRAVPCFDEPDNKVKWHLTLDVPANLAAVANEPEAQTTVLDDGFKRVEFAPGMPMPSYLVAFAVGPFEFVDAGTSRGGVPLRIVTLKGRAGEAEWAAKTTLPLLNLLEDYTGIPYPYAKIDSISIPTTIGFGAMENIGLITYADRLLLANPARQTEEQRRR
jgi:alanyl aminopeptidase